MTTNSNRNDPLPPTLDVEGLARLYTVIRGRVERLEERREGDAHPVFNDADVAAFMRLVRTSQQQTSPAAPAPVSEHADGEGHSDDEESDDENVYTPDFSLNVSCTISEQTNT